MKIDKIKVLVILIILLSNLIVLDCEKFRRMSKSHHLSHHKKRSKGILDTIMNTLKSFVTNPENIFYFVLGITTVFHSSVEEFYKKIKSLIHKFKPCVDSLKSLYENVEELINPEEKEKLEKHNEEIKKVESMYSGTEDKFKFCENVQKQIQDYYISAGMELPELNGYNSGVMGYLTSGALYLNYKTESIYMKCHKFEVLKAKKTQSKIEKQFGNIYNYINQCEYFVEMDCDEFKPETAGIWNFIMTAYKYYSLYKKTKQCITNVFELNHEDKSFSSIDHSFLTTSVATAIGAVANILTLGAWGGVKGGFYLIQLGMDLYSFYKNTKEDLPFNLGKLFGKGILVAKSLILGKKKRKFKKIK